MGEFDMNALLRGIQTDEQGTDESPGDEKSIGGKSDAGAGAERMATAGTDMNAFLREAVFDSRGPRA